MSPLAWIITLGILATVFGLVVLIAPILKFYWGENGKPPVTGEEKKKLREEELQMRAAQIEHSKKNPIATRNSSFWDNRKVYK